MEGEWKWPGPKVWERQRWAGVWERVKEGKGGSYGDSEATQCSSEGTTAPFQW
jgi:hypothetical protein